MKKLVAFLSVFVASSIATAGTKDLRLMKTLIRGGVTSEQFMSQIHVGVDEVECIRVKRSGVVTCSMTDIAPNDGQGAKVNMTGKNARSLYDSIALIGDPPVDAGGLSEVKVKTIRCKQAIPGVADGPEARRTHCWMELYDLIK